MEKALIGVQTNPGLVLFTIVDEKLRTFLDNVDIGRTDYDNRSLLHIACSEGHIEIIELLLEKGAKQCHDRWGNTPTDDFKRFLSENEKTLTIEQKNFELLF